MKSEYLTGAALVAAVFIAVPAAAQEVATTESRAGHFDGLYVGGAFGAGGSESSRLRGLEFDTNRDGTYGDQVTTVAGGNAFSPGFCAGSARGASRDTGCRSNKNDILFAGRVGIDRRMGSHFVVGGLLEASRNNSLDYTSGFSTTPASYTIARGIDYAFSARGRAGFTPNGGILFYATGGGSYARIDHDFYTTNTANSFTERRDDKMVWGWQAGGGAEIMVTNHVSVGLEYLFNNYKDDKYSVAVAQGTAAATNPFLQAGAGTDLRGSDDRLKFHALQATVNLQF